MENIELVPYFVAFVFFFAWFGFGILVATFVRRYIERKEK